MATVFDTLSFSRKLIDAGMERRQADALAGAVHDAVSGSVVTKPMLDTAVSDLRLEVQGVRASLMTVQWMTGASVAGVLALIARSFF